MPRSHPATPRPAGPSRRAWALWWGLAAAWWTLDGFTTATNYYRMSQVTGGITWEHAFRAGMWSAWLWVPLTLLAVWVAHRLPLSRDTWRRYLPAHLAAAVGVCLVRAGAVVLLNPWAGWYTALPPFREVLLTSFSNNFFVFGLMVGVGHAAVYARRARERDEQLARAELRALKSQLHPHFLFNALNTVSAYVRTDPDAAERMIARLSELLRHALSSPGSHEVPLAEELRVARAYLEIEQVRFEDRLRVRWDVDPEAYEAAVPHLILQPLVENAIRHGIAPRAAEGTLAITAARRNGTLHLEVRDDGVGLPPEAAEGVGLANTRARLHQLYGDRQRMEVVPAEGGGVHVRLTMPFRQQAG
jgi:two-component system, LytTR family, sensor kinase